MVVRGHATWFHSISSPEGVGCLYRYVERMLLADSYLSPPADLMGRQFERYIDDGEPSRPDARYPESAASGN